MPKFRVCRHVPVQPLDQSYRLIPLTQGQNAIVDASDFEWLSQWNWQVQKGWKTLYAVRHDKTLPTKQTKVNMHCEIIGFKGCDHVNRNGLDNRRENLRAATVNQQSYNMSTYNTNKSGFRGVFYVKRSRKWLACIKADGKRIHIGFFESKLEAAIEYNKAAMKYHGEFASLNKVE